MKDATGELSMTIVVIIAVIAIVGILSVFLIPSMRNYIKHSWEDMTNAGNQAANTQLNAVDYS
ncbi:MAG: hypothetical protein VZS44_06125 [Bacilli bacterium]|nr:hypothetical protein [Bacilli bacterium]